MSVRTQTIELECEVEKGGEGIELIIQPQEKDLGGFSVRRSLPTQARKTVGPWVFFDHMGPAKFAAGTGINVRPHPHINLATVTYLFEGEILHRDSLGSYATIAPGDINLMVAGRGIVHSERERPEVTNVEHNLHGLQLWLALPSEDEETDPAFYHYPAASLPATIINHVPVRVLMGSAYGLTSPVKTYAQTLYVEAHLQAGQTLEIVQCAERAVYVAMGQLTINGKTVPAYSMVILSDQQEVTIEATQQSRIALIGGEQIGKRYMEWNFVSSRKDRLEQGKQDWQKGKFPKVVGDEQEYIPWPKKG